MRIKNTSYIKITLTFKDYWAGPRDTGLHIFLNTMTPNEMIPNNTDIGGSCPPLF